MVEELPGTSGMQGGNAFTLVRGGQQVDSDLKIQAGGEEATQTLKEITGHLL